MLPTMRFHISVLPGLRIFRQVAGFISRKDFFQSDKLSDVCVLHIEINVVFCFHFVDARTLHQFCGN